MKHINFLYDLFLEKLLNKSKFIALFAVILFSGIVVTQAYAQDPVHQQSLSDYGTVLLSFVAAGLFYSIMGASNAYRRRIATQNWAGFDFVKLGKSVTLGVVLGIGAFIAVELQGQVIMIGSLHEFLVQVGLNTTAILMIQKFLLGGYAVQPKKEEDELKPTTLPTKTAEEGEKGLD